MSDKVIICTDCKTEFVFTDGEQDFYKEKGFENDPKRCSPCRKARKLHNSERIKQETE